MWGGQFDYEPDFTHSYEFDAQAVEFCKAVLERSSSIGVRGEITAKYLERLGFKNHIRIIGCPSMYMHGENLELRIPKRGLTYQSKISTNAGKGTKRNIWELIERCFDYFENCCFLGQGSFDLKLVYAGVPHRKGEINYPCDPIHPWMKSGRMKFCINTPSWLDFLATRDFSIGTKIHGTIAAILAGTPSYIYAIDSRTRELAEYHNIPHQNASVLENTFNPYTIFDNTDFSKIQLGHKDRLQVFADFLTENGLVHIFQDNNKTALDEEMQSIQYFPAVESLFDVDSYEQAERLYLWGSHMNRKVDSLNEKIRILTKKIEEK